MGHTHGTLLPQDLNQLGIRDTNLTEAPLHRFERQPTWHPVPVSWGTPPVLIPFAARESRESSSPVVRTGAHDRTGALSSLRV